MKVSTISLEGLPIEEEYADSKDLWNAVCETRDGVHMLSRMAAYVNYNGGLVNTIKQRSTIYEYTPENMRIHSHYEDECERIVFVVTFLKTGFKKEFSFCVEELYGFVDRFDMLVHAFKVIWQNRDVQDMIIGKAVNAALGTDIPPGPETRD